MQIRLSKDFTKSFAKLPVKVQQKFEIRAALFLKNPFERILENHPLKGKLVHFRSFSVTGDYRVKFVFTGDGNADFVDIGRHPDIYK